MPIYEYQCQQCGHQLEALQKISDDPLVECPKCKGASLQKLVSAASFRLKGGGWYETDFKSGDKKHLAESDSGNSGSSKEKESTKTKESEPAVKAKSAEKTKPSDSGTDKTTKTKTSGKKNND